MLAEAVAVLIPGRPQGQYILFCRDKDKEREIWTGRRAGPQGATEKYGADDAFPIDDIDDILPGLLEHRERVFYTLGRDTAFDRVIDACAERVLIPLVAGVDSLNAAAAAAIACHVLRRSASRSA